MQAKIWTRHVQGIVIASLLGMMAGGTAHGVCNPQNVGGINNSGTIAGVGVGSVGTQVAINQNTTGGTQLGQAPSTMGSGATPGGGPSSASPGSATQPGAQTGGATTTVYNPLTDPNLPDKDKPIDPDKVNNLVSNFQQGQWKPLDSRNQTVQNQPPAQPQPPGYLSSTTITTLTTVPPTTTTTPSTVLQGGTSVLSTVRPGGTTTPTTVRLGGTTTATTAKPTTTTTGTTPQNLTDVTVDRRDVTITVWDHSGEDGDIISIYMNGNVLKKNIMLTNKKQSFKVKLTAGQNRFEVEAVNEGSTPPNTASVEISNVTKGKPSQVCERKTGQRASMNLTAP